MLGSRAKFLGDGDLHDPVYDNFNRTVDLALHTRSDFATTPGHCMFEMTVYPSERFVKSYDSKTPEIFAAVVAFTFLLVALFFFFYDLMVQRRNQKLVENAARSHAIVTSMFPGIIRDRLLGNHNNGNNDTGDADVDADELHPGTSTSNLKAFMHKGDEALLNNKNNRRNSSEGAIAAANTKPMADIFLETTVMFADVRCLI